jgi:hypothetical protein
MATAPFDPDAYLKARQSFDPDKYLSKAVSPPPSVDPGETFVGRGVQAIPLGGPLSDVLAATLLQSARSRHSRATLTKEAKSELEAMGETVPEGVSFLDEYRDVRDRRKERTEAGAEQNPKAAMAGTATGVAASIFAPLPKATVGSGAKGRLLSASLTGAAYGAENALSNGEADLTRGEVPTAAKEATQGALLGAGLGLVGGAVGEGARYAAPLFRRVALQQGKQHLQGGSDMQAVNRRPLSDEAVEEVLQRGGIRPLATVQGTAPRVEALAQEQGRIYGQIVEELEARGVQGPRVKELADDLYERYLRDFNASSGDKGPANVFREEAENVQRIAYPGPRGDAVRVTDGVEGPPVVEGPQAPRLRLTQAEDVKRSLQERAKFEKRNPTGKEDNLREASAMVRQANEDAIANAAMRPGVDPRIQELNAQFVPQKGIVGRLLEAEEAASRGAAKAEQRSPISLKDNQAGAAIATASGMPFLYWPTALANSAVRNRASSTAAVEAYTLAEALRSGRAGANIARGLEGAAEPSMDAARDYADENADDATLSPLAAALLRALRRTPKKKD